uniref:Uncharacterized protein n=1 Tax=Myotis myotis TaxID=51298 RepID=A0A7J7Y164_MYOMY|nr:hypothetical protein mMyoMyo1_011481 [Myotis myotis]
MRTEPGRVGRGLLASAALGHSSQGICGFLSWTGLWRLPEWHPGWSVLTCFLHSPKLSPLLNVNRGPRKQTCSLSRGHPGTPMSCRGRSTSQSPGAGAQGLGQGTASCLPGPGGGCLLDPHPGGSFPLWLIHLCSTGSCGTGSPLLK